MNDQHDAVVIGAGPGGSFTAHRLASMGIRTLLVEKASFPRPKLCGGCLAKPGQSVLASAGLRQMPSLLAAPRIERLDLRTGSRTLRLRVPEYRVIDRSEFDSDLVHAAVGAGASFRDDTTAVIRPDRTVDLAGRDQTQTIRPRVIIIADGLAGTSLRDYPGFDWTLAPKSHVGIGGIARALPPGCHAGAVTMHHARHGYLGLAPLSNGRADIAAAVDPAWIRDNSGGPPLTALLASFGIDADSLDLLHKPLGAPQLTRRRNTLEDAGQIFLCGDAAGYLEPFTGEGMTWALEAASLLTPYVLKAMEGTYATGDWSNALRKEWSRRRLLCRSVSAMLRRPRLTGALATLGAAVPPVASVMTRAIESMQSRPGTGPAANPEPAATVGGV